MTSMHHAGFKGASWRGSVGGLLLFIMLVPQVRTTTESSMTAHMLVQYPCLILSGALLVKELPPRWLSASARWNQLGISGLVGSAFALALLMIPRVLDLSIVDGRVDAVKILVLLGTGAALSLSWQRAGVVIQAFFLGNVLGMTAVTGILYQDSAVRVCNAYRLDEQQDLGVALVVIALATGAIWLFHTGWSRARRQSSLFALSPNPADLDLALPQRQQRARDRSVETWE